MGNDCVGERTTNVKKMPGERSIFVLVVAEEIRVRARTVLTGHSTTTKDTVASTTNYCTTCSRVSCCPFSS